MSQPRRKYCPSGKALWPTRKMALGSANVTAARHGLALRVYKCRECHHWHLTKQQEQGARRPQDARLQAGQMPQMQQ